MTKNISDHITVKFQNIKTKNMEMAMLKSWCVFYESPDILCREQSDQQSFIEQHMRHLPDIVSRMLKQV
mgnify:CR=1 FL=1